MAQWIKKGTDVTEAYDKIQGREIVLDEPNRQWKLIVTHRTGVRRTLGIWGKDAQHRDVIIFNGSYSDGQEILIDASYSNVHVAVNFTPDEPPKNRRWSIQGSWYRQAFHDARVDVEKWVYR